MSNGFALSAGSSPPSLLTTAARGGLRPAPDCRPRRALLHLSYSSAPVYPDGAFVTHDPEPTFASPADCWVHRRAVIRTTRISSSRQLVEQHLRLSQIGRVEAFG